MQLTVYFPSSTLPTLHENSELSLEAGPGVGQPAPSLSSLPASLMSSLTQANLSLTARKRYQVTSYWSLHPSPSVFVLLQTAHQFLMIFADKFSNCVCT